MGEGVEKLVERLKVLDALEPELIAQTQAALQRLQGERDEAFRRQRALEQLRQDEVAEVCRDLAAAEAQVEALRKTLEEIREECCNPGYPNDIVATRMIERIEETAAIALSATEGERNEDGRQTNVAPQCADAQERPAGSGDIVARLRALAALEPGWYANVGRKAGEQCCAAMREAADELEFYFAEIDRWHAHADEIGLKLEEAEEALAKAEESSDHPAEQDAHELTKALTGLVGGGSEMFVQKRGRFLADIPYCVERIRDRLQRAEKRSTAALVLAKNLTKSVEKARDLTLGIGDRLEDEGDRVYLGSTNDADTIRNLGHELADLALPAPAEARGSQPEWRPIETAPRDGTFIVGRIKDYSPVVLSWRAYAWGASGEARWRDCKGQIYKPTMWSAVPSLAASPAPAQARAEQPAAVMPVEVNPNNPPPSVSATTPPKA